MFMKKHGVLISIFVVLIIAISFFAVNSYRVHTKRIIFFYSEQCPHCENIEAFFVENDVRSKVTFTEKEVSKNRHNLMQLVKIEKGCNMEVKDTVDVPLLWTGVTCIVGDTEIINFFKAKISR
jgi:hypothetical protein